MRCLRYLFCAGLLLSCALPAFAQDADGDGIPDVDEELLGTDPKLNDALKVVLTDGVEAEAARAKAGYDAGKDIVSVECASVGGNRVLWRVNFAGEPTLKNTVLHLYVDADGDEQTGREGGPGGAVTGTDYMISIVGGSAGVGYYQPDHTRAAGPVATAVAVGKAVLITADVDLGRDAQGLRYKLYVLCHTSSTDGQPPMSDSTGKVPVEGVPISPKDKIQRPTDFTTNVNVTATYGLDILRALLRDPATIEVRYDQLECDGYEIDLQTQDRFGKVKQTRARGKVTARVPKAGKYLIGFMMYDGGNDERILFRVNGEVAGFAVSNQDNNRTWLYYLTKPRDLKAGDRISLEACGSGSHGICNVLFFPKPPPTRKVDYRIGNLKAAVPVGTRGKATISWTTVWPSDSRFEYGPTTRYGQVAEEQCYRLVHKVRLEGLTPGATYHGRAVAKDRSGQPYASPDFTFTVTDVKAPATKPGVTSIPLRVRNPHPVPAAQWPVTGGVPFPQGQLAGAEQVRLTRDGREVAAQIAPTGTWPDGSLKWVLVTFLADLPAGGEATYTLEFGRDVKRASAAGPLATESADGVTVSTGALSFLIDRHGRLARVTRDGQSLLTGSCGTVLAEAKATSPDAAATAELTIEENGPVRAVIKTVADLADAAGKPSFRVEQRLTAWRGRAEVQVSHTFVNTRPETFTNLERLSYEVPLKATWRLPVVEGQALELAPGQAAVQRFDREVVGPDGRPVKTRLTGAALADGAGVAVRDFWQQYPKGLAADATGLRVDLCPDFEEGLYDAFPFEKEGHQLYYYLLGGHYRFRRGTAKTHELLLSFAPGDNQAACTLFGERLLPTAPPAWYCDSLAFYHVQARDEQRFKAYEESVDKNVAAYADQRERQHDYGLMNYGDWYGERGANWGNIEYDTQHAMFLEYIRSGNPLAFHLGEAAQVHNRDIDTVQWSSNPHDLGAVYVHQMGHVGGYYDQSVPGTLGIPSAGYTVSHAWTEGHFDHYFLTGDRRSLETGMAVADFFIDKELSRPYDFLSCRTPGWHLIMNAAAQAATNDPYYLNASRVIVDRVLETQDVEPRPMPLYQQAPGRTTQTGGWTRMMVPGHCTCEPRHQGNAGFMVAILLTGLTYYHDVTAEPAVKQAIIRGARFLLEDTYSPEVHGFKYTSCPNMRHTAGATPLMVEGIARAYRWTKDPFFKDCLTNGLAAGARGSGYGKGFSMYYRCAPRLLADLVACGLTLDEQLKVALAPFVQPDWMKRLKPEQQVLVQAEAFAEQGGGACEIRDDRHGAYGKMITKWHQDAGHWLSWQLQVPADARYRMVFRYATDSQATRRKVELDGKVVPSAESLAFPRTGGYALNPRDWGWLTLKDGGREVIVPLAKGAHTLKMTNLGDGLALDFILLVREDAGPIG